MAAGNRTTDTDELLLSGGADGVNLVTQLANNLRPSFHELPYPGQFPVILVLIE